MKDVVVEDCIFSEYIWQNARREGEPMSALHHFGVTELGETIPEELKDPENWLADERDGTNELRRALEAGSIADIPPEGSHQQTDPGPRRETSSNEAFSNNYWIRAAEAAEAEQSDRSPPANMDAFRANNTEEWIRAIKAGEIAVPPPKVSKNSVRQANKNERVLAERRQPTR